jgi:hypothetical protein
MLTKTQDITPIMLTNLVRRYNCSCWVFGAILLVIAAFFWVIAAYLSFLVFSYFHFTSSLRHADLAAGVWVALYLGAVGAIGFSQQSLFFTVQPNWKLPALSGAIHIQPLSVVSFLLLILCAAPIVTSFGLYRLRLRLRPDDREIILACSLLAHLKENKSWTSFPRLVSQRQSILLLNELHLIQISRRFGKLHVKVKGLR